MVTFLATVESWRQPLFDKVSLFSPIVQIIFHKFNFLTVKAHTPLLTLLDITRTSSDALHEWAARALWGLLNDNEVNN